MLDACKIDYEKRIIYISIDVNNSDLLTLFAKLSEGEIGLKAGPNVKWRIMVIQQ